MRHVRVGLLTALLLGSPALAHVPSTPAPADNTPSSSNTASQQPSSYQQNYQSPNQALPPAPGDPSFIGPLAPGDPGFQQQITTPSGPAAATTAAAEAWQRQEDERRRNINATQNSILGGPIGEGLGSNRLNDPGVRQSLQSSINNSNESAQRFGQSIGGGGGLFDLMKQ
jgi:hypothetical protein